MSSKGSHLPKDEIFHAIHNGNLDLLKTLITPEHANIKDRSGYSLLHVATNQEKNEIAKWLVTVGSDINMHCNGHTVTSLALTKGNFELFQFYLDNNGDCQGRNQLNLLHEAANKNRCDIVVTLIEKGVDPNLLNNLHCTPLTIAVTQKNTEICQILLDNGACANIPDKKGNTALHVACSLGSNEVINVLLDNTECDLKMKNVNEETPLDLLWTTAMQKVQEPSHEMLDKFIASGAVFSTPWNFVFNPQNHFIFLKSMACLCKYHLKDLFLHDKPLYTDLIIHGYWRNALIVSIKAAVIDFKSQSQLNDQEMFELIEKVITSNEIELNERDLCSTFYMFDDVQEYEVCKMLKKLMSSRSKDQSPKEKAQDESLNSKNDAIVPPKSIKAEIIASEHNATEQQTFEEENDENNHNSTEKLDRHDSISNHSNSNCSINNSMSLKKSSNGTENLSEKLVDQDEATLSETKREITTTQTRPSKKHKKH